MTNGDMQVWLESVDSTNDAARRLLPHVGPDGVVLVAITQTHGRGRLNRRWESPPGGLYYTHMGPTRGMTPLSVAQVVQQVGATFGIQCHIEWPNDLIIGHQKWGGVLIEQIQHPITRVRYDMIGIGLNLNEVVFPTDSYIKAISAQAVLGHPVSIAKWASALTKELACQ